jgi:hypothetical protein
MTSDPVSLTESSWFEPEDQVVLVSYDRVTLTLTLEEFLDFYDLVSETRDQLLEMKNACIGTFEENGTIKKQIMILPSDEELN